MNHYVWFLACTHRRQTFLSIAMNPCFLFWNLLLVLFFLAHLSRRLIGELIVYEGIRRPSVVRPSVVRLSTFSNDISSEAVRPILFIFHI